MIRFLHSGDWQLGMTRSVLGDAAQARFDDARFDAIRRIGDVARRERCAFVLVCGDVFESNQIDRRTLARALDALNEIECPIYLLPGNHDPLDNTSIFRRSAFRDAAPATLHVIEDSTPIEVAPGVELVGAPWLSRRPQENPASIALAGLGPAGPLRIFAAHGGLDVLSPDRRDASQLALAPLDHALDAGLLHYVALGDRHSLTRFGKAGRVCYAGAPVATDWGEREPGFALAVELDRESVRSEAHAICDWRFVGPERFALSGEADLAALGRWLEEQPLKERTVLRLELEGSLDLAGAARLEGVFERARDLFAGLDLRDTLHIAAADADLDSLGLGGFVERAARRLRAESDDGDEAACDALALLVRLASHEEGRP